MSFQVFSSKIVFLIISVTGILILGIKLYFLNLEKKKRFKETNKKWILEEYVYNIGGGIGFINLFIQMVNLSPESFSNTVMIIASVILTAFILLIYITSFVLPSKIEEILLKQYPEYKLV